jgi:hypothetical protein
MPFRARSRDDDSVYRCAKLCHDIAGEVLEFLPHTRESQRILVDLLTGRLAASGEDFPINVRYIAETIKCPDEYLIANWRGSYENLAWLMVHEALSHFFARFVLDNWPVEPYLIHHVPKSAGTSLYELIHAQSYFVAYPQTTFSAMCVTSGLVGFPAQLAEFERHSTRQDRIYLGGHFNLPSMLDSLGKHGNCQGISLVRSPIESISSAIRYVWTLIEQKDAAWAAAYPSFAPQQLTSIREAATRSDDSAALAAMRETASAILQGALFQENYDELLCQYYYNGKVDDPTTLTGLLEEYRNIVPCIDMARDEELIRWQLRIDGKIPRVNVSLLSHRDLARAFGGDQAFRAAIAPRILRSSEIYGVLCAQHVRSAPTAVMPS